MNVYLYFYNFFKKYIDFAYLCVIIYEAQMVGGDNLIKEVIILITLKKNVQRLCLDRGITVLSLERELGFPAGTIAQWRNSTPSVTRVKMVSDYFGVTVDNLLNDKRDFDGKQ